MLTIRPVTPYSQSRYQSFGNLAEASVAITQETARTTHIDTALRTFVQNATHNEILATQRLLPHLKTLLEKVLADSGDLNACKKTLNALSQDFVLPCKK